MSSVNSPCKSDDLTFSKRPLVSSKLSVSGRPLKCSVLLLFFAIFSILCPLHKLPEIRILSVARPAGPQSPPQVRIEFCRIEPRPPSGSGPGAQGHWQNCREKW